MAAHPERTTHTVANRIGGREAPASDGATFERRNPADRDDVVRALSDAGYVPSAGNTQDTPHPAGADPGGWSKRFWGGCDPGEFVHVHVREHGRPGWRFALLFRDWLAHVPAERDAYAAEKRRLLALDASMGAYVEAKEPWFEVAWHRANAWAVRTGWRPEP